MQKLNQLFRDAGNVAKSTTAKVGAGLTAMSASALAFAGGATSPGAAMAGELSGGKADIMLVIGAAALLLGALILWGYVKRAR